MSFLKSISIYSFISVYQAALIFLSLSLFSHYMDTDKFALYNLYLAILPFLMNFMILGVTGSLSVYFHHVDIIKYRQYLGQVVFYILPISFIVGIIIFLISRNFASYYFNFEQNTLFIIVLLVFFQIVPQILLTYYQTSLNAKKYAYFNIPYLTLNFIFSIFSFFYSNDINLIFFLLLMNAILFSIIAIVIFRMNSLISPRFNKKIFFAILSYGLPLIIHAVGISLLFMMDRFFISYFLGNKEVAIYSVALQLCKVTLIFVNSFAAAWGPYLFKELKHAKLHISIDFVKKIYFSIIVFFILPFILFYIQKNILYIFFDQQYEVALNYIFIIGIGYASMGVYKVFIGFLHYKKMTKIISTLTLSALIINSILNYYFIISYGSLGVSYSTLLSMIFLALCTIYISNHQYKIQWRIK